MKRNALLPLLGASLLSLGAADAAAGRVATRSARTSKAAPAGQASAGVRARNAAPARASSGRGLARRGGKIGAALRQSIDSYKEAMGATVLHNSTPAMRVMPHAAGGWTQTRSANYHDNVTAQFEVKGLGADGEAAMTVLFPVSGHLGPENAQEYARSNVYKVQLLRADGTQENLPDVPSAGLVTEITHNLKLAVGVNTLRVWPSATSVGGFRPGREVEIVWSGN